MTPGTEEVYRLLSNLCEEVECQIKSRLRSPIGDVISGYLPQTWVFETEIGSCVVYIDREGFARVHPGSDSARDVTIRWRQAELKEVLSRRNRDSIANGDYPDVVVHTDKGRAAFNFLKKEIGL